MLILSRYLKIFIIIFNLHVKAEEEREDDINKWQQYSAVLLFHKVTFSFDLNFANKIITKKNFKVFSFYLKTATQNEIKFPEVYHLVFQYVVSILEALALFRLKVVKHLNTLHVINCDRYVHSLREQRVGNRIVIYKFSCTYLHSVLTKIPCVRRPL